MTYNPAAWYWIVASNISQVWSSAQAAYVSITDATYVAWLTAGGLPSRIISEAELQAVLAAQYPAGWPPTLAQQALAALSAGMTIVSTATPALNGTYAVDSQSTANITEMQVSINAGLGLPLGLPTVEWADMAGAMHAFTAAQLTTLAAAMRDYVYRLKIIATTNTGTLPTQPVTIP